MTSHSSGRGEAAAYARDDAKLAALEQRVYGLERGVQDLNQLFTGRIGEVSAQLTGLATKLDDRSRTPWGTIVSAMGVVLALVVAGGQLARTPLDDAIRRLERDYAALDARARDARAETVQRHELEERRRAEDQAIASVQRQIDDLKQGVRPISGAEDVIGGSRDRSERARAPGSD